MVREAPDVDGLRCGSAFVCAYNDDVIDDDTGDSAGEGVTYR